MAKRGRYSNETKEQAELFINMLDGNVDDAHGMAFERSEMFWDEVASGERDEEDAKKATTLTNYLGHLTRKSK
jgi:hypothetical protein